jgi:hypothetical protein
MNEMERSQLEAAMEDVKQQFALACVKLGEVLLIVAPMLAQAGRDLNAALETERRVLGFIALGADAVWARELVDVGFDPAVNTESLRQMIAEFRPLREPKGRR